MTSSPFSWLERSAAFLVLFNFFPILLVIALIIRLGAGRPLLERAAVGPDGLATAHRLRFRTTGFGTPFLQKVGRWLRETQLDELPLFWSIARGEIRFRDARRFCGRR